jgi:phosphatidate cytidylyltransferase
VPFDDDPKRNPDKEGVRIIGAEEAAEALERDDVAHRRAEGEPKYGDRPSSPSADGPRPTIRFPLPADESPDAAGSARAAGDLPHWTDPPTGEVPRIFAAEDLGDNPSDASAWSSFTSGQPRWRGEGDVDEGVDDFSQLADDETRVGAMAGDDRPDPEDFFAFDDEAPDPRWGEQAAVPAGGTWEDADDPYASGRTRSISSDPRRASSSRTQAAYQRPANAGRNVPVAIGVGIGLLALALVAFAAGPKFAVALVTVVVAAAAAELFSVLRQAGYQPATLLGLASCVALPLAAYYKGEPAIPVVLFLTVVFGLVWFLVGAGGPDRPVLGLSSTLLGVGWVGLLGTGAALMLHLGEQGIGILWVAILGTVGYDVGGFVVGRNAGTRPLSAVSPNKTMEGLAGGVLGAVAVSVIAASYIAPFADADFVDAVIVALAIAIAAPLGDLCESLVKRDLDVKDMGTFLPGHGGVLDRFDAMLFVLPTVYYLARVLLP